MLQIPTRNELSRLTQDDRLLRAFESLFLAAGRETPTDIDGLTTSLEVIATRLAEAEDVAEAGNLSPAPFFESQHDLTPAVQLAEGYTGSFDGTNTVMVVDGLIKGII